MFLSTLSRLRSASNRPQAGSRGKNASLLIIQYARDAPGKGGREREREEDTFTSTYPASRKYFPWKKEKEPPPFPLLEKSPRKDECCEFKETFEFIPDRYILFAFFSPKSGTKPRETSSTYLPPRVARNVRERKREGGRENVGSPQVGAAMGARGQLEIVPNNRGTRWTVHSYLAGWILLSLRSDPLPYLRIPR